MRNKPLYESITSHDFGSGGIERFAAKLGEEADLPADEARQLARDYLRFVYLTQASDQPLVPSELIAKAWYLHRVGFAQDYQRLAGKLPKRAVVVDVDGKGQAGKRLSRGYRATLDFHRAELGPVVPAFWPVPPRKNRAWVKYAVAGAGLIAIVTGVALGQQVLRFAGFAIAGLGLLLVMPDNDARPSVKNPD